MRVIVMLPTYNEAENIGRCLDQILSLPVDAGALVVDDLSPDGTGEIADEYAARYPGRVEVLHRQGRRGRGWAGIAGFLRCTQMPVEYVIEMDADLQHDPADIPRFVAAADRIGADVVVGSRYVAGGGEVDRSARRKIVSRLASLYLRATLGIRLRDCSTGYRLFRRDSLTALEPGTMSASGPWILQETIWRATRRKMRIVEIPIFFQPREAGESKLNVRILVRSLTTPFVLRWRSTVLRIF